MHSNYISKASETWIAFVAAEDRLDQYTMGHPKSMPSCLLAHTDAAE